jgi:hypothetical protein
MGLYQQVFVDVSRERFHVKADCKDARLTRHWCAAAAAHRSRLEPCVKCASGLAKELRSTLGSIPSGAKKGLALPRLQTIRGRAEGDQSDDDQDYELYYGAPDSLDDPRFSTRSQLDWGTASFGQDPDEFLGGPTNDDNDWRGSNRMYD